MMMLASQKNATLHDAIGVGDIQRIKEILATIKTGSELDTDYQSIYAPVHRAVLFGSGPCDDFETRERRRCSLEILKLLLEKGASLDILTKNGAHSAISLVLTGSRNVTMLNFLLEHGADPNKQLVKEFSLLMYPYGNGCTALHLAAHLSQGDQILALLPYIKNPNMPLNYGVTPLHIAVFWAYEEVVISLLKHNHIDLECRSNALNNNPMTPFEMVVYLLKLSKVNMQDPVEWQQNSHFKILRYLKLEGAKIDEGRIKQLIDSQDYLKIIKFFESIDEEVVSIRTKPFASSSASLPADQYTAKHLLLWQSDVQQYSLDYQLLLCSILDPKCDLNSKKQLGKLQTLPQELRDQILSYTLMFLNTIKPIEKSAQDNFHTQPSA